MLQDNFIVIVLSALLIGYCLGKVYNEFFAFPARMYQPITSLPAYQGGFGTPIDNINLVPQLAQMEQAVYQGQWGEDSIANLKLTTQHSNLIKNIN